ncbi:MAG: translation initiation factor IF-2 N-terminal domain-containing protein, partial [Actinomycetota bacterium]|nr:translation initiation factor IF-2 N-terminal domain-containing protein [Actinomycetota bacterium]
MAKKRVHEIAKAQGVSSKELLAALKAAGVDAKAAASTVEEAEALKAISGARGNGGGDGAKQAPAAAKPAPQAAKPAAQAAPKAPAAAGKPAPQGGKPAPKGPQTSTKP